MREDKELAVQLAEIARRTAVIGVFRAHSSTSLAELQEAVEHGPLAETLRSIQVAELRQHRPPALRVRVLDDASLERAVLEVFERAPAQWFASSYFVQRLDLKRWSAQSLLGNLVARGKLVRRGITSATRYRLATDESCCALEARPPQPACA